MRDHVGAQFAGHACDGLSLHGALGTHAQRVHLAATHVAHDQKAQHFVEIVGARIDLMVIDSAQRNGALCQCLGSCGIDATGVYRDGDDRTTGVLGDPGH